ncbi:MAG: dehydrogenase [Clostridia bacterium]|nr:dehydrogenase [Clostridia bacterium]
MSPMCVYSAEDDGLARDWHLVHYGSRAVGGVGLIIQEATAVEKRGRISNRDLGLWDDSHLEPLEKIVSNIHRAGAKVGIQLAHAGRKCGVPGERIVAPSAMKWSDEYPVPAELTIDEIQDIVKAFGKAARRAVIAGYNLIEIHAAHGYLIHQFLSPLSNTRKDEYGGTRENRVRFLQEVLTEVRRMVYEEMPIIIRVSASDYMAGGLDLEETIDIINLIRDKIDIVDVSSGGLLPVNIDTYPGYQVRFSEAIRQRCQIPTIAVGLITEPEQAEQIIGEGRADMVALGRELLRNPYWPIKSGEYLGDEVEWPTQYLRAKI